MSDRPFIAARIEERVNRFVETALRAFGWRETIVAYAGYGSSAQLRVMGRIVLTPPRSKTVLARDLEKLMQRRGWRNFIATAAVCAPARVTVGDETVVVHADRGGYIDARIPNRGLQPGWQEVELVSRKSEPVKAPVFVVADDVKFGLVSDIDDTVMVTYLPRPMIAFWNAFVLEESARQPIPGMAEMYEQLLSENPGAPLIYLSTGAWDTVPFLSRFLERNGYPRGTFLLTDWGPTNTGWFRSGQDHKRRALRALARDFPSIRWVLVGDDGQHDPSIYNDFGVSQPKRVRAIAIRELSPAEQVLSHGLPTPLTDEELEAQPDTVVEVRSPDGHGLLDKLRPILAHKKKRDGEPLDPPPAEEDDEAAPEPEAFAEETLGRPAAKDIPTA